MSAQGAPDRSRQPMDAIWEALEEVKDPEIPVVSLVDLGVVRAIGYQDRELVVSLTPTFAACPAWDVMRREVVERLEALGIERVTVRMVLHPPWSSDLIRPAARLKLKEFGLAPPPVHAGDLTAAIERKPDCPRCDSHQVTLKNAFGSTLCRAMYVCETCREPFEAFKPI